MNAFAMEFQIPVRLRSFHVSLNLYNYYISWVKRCWFDTFFYLQDGDIINIDVTVYLNVSCICFFGVMGC